MINDETLVLQNNKNYVVLLYLQDALKIKIMKLKVDETKFFVNEKKKSVTCVITGVLQVSNMGIDITFIVPKRNNCLNRSVWNDPDRIQTFNNFTVTATTKCKEGDVFDPIKGRKIAKQKARIKMYKEATKLCLEAYNLFVSSELEESINTFICRGNTEILDYEKNVLEIELPEKVETVNNDGTINEYVLFEDFVGVGYMRTIETDDKPDDYDVLFWESTRMELLEQINNDENVKFEGKGN